MDNPKQPPSPTELIVSLSMAENEIKFAKHRACAAKVAEELGNDNAVKTETYKALEAIDRAKSHINEVAAESLTDAIASVLEDDNLTLHSPTRPNLRGRDG